MAPNLAASQHAMIYDIIVSKTLSAAQMADAANYSKRLIKRIRSNICCFGTTKAPPNGVGRRRSITSSMLQALQQHLLEKARLCARSKGEIDFVRHCSLCLRLAFVFGQPLSSARPPLWPAFLFGHPFYWSRLPSTVALIC